MKTKRRHVAWGVAVLLVVAACGEGRPVFGDTSPPTDPVATPVDLPEPAYVIVDEDPESPVSVIIGFELNPDGVEAVTFLGDKLPSDTPPRALLFDIAGEDDPLTFTFDPLGRPEQIVAPDGSELRVLSYEGDRAMVLTIAADGSTATTTIDVPTIDVGFLEETAMAASPTGVQVVSAAHELDPSAPLTVTSSVSGGYTTVLSSGLRRSDVALRSAGCSIAYLTEAGGTDAVSCSTLVGPAEITVRTVIDVNALYGGDAPDIRYETRQECESSRHVTLGVGGLLLAGAFVTLVATGVGALAIGSVVGFAGILGIGSASALVTTVAGGSLVVIAGKPCTAAIVTNEDLRMDVADRLAGSLSVGPELTTLVGRNPGHWTVTVAPASQSFEPFGPNRPEQLEWTTVTVEPTDDTGTTLGEPGSIEGTYVGSLTRYPEQDLIGITTSEAVVRVEGTSISGTERFVAVRTPDYGESVTVAVEGTQWVEFSGTIGADGSFRVPGRSFSEFRLVSCEGNSSSCNNVSPPDGSSEGYPVEVVGTIEGGILTADILWPGNDTPTYGFQAVRTG